MNGDNGRIAGRVFSAARLLVWHDGAITFLRPPAGASLEATGVNNNGQGGDARRPGPFAGPGLRCVRWGMIR